MRCNLDIVVNPPKVMTPSSIALCEDLRDYGKLMEPIVVRVLDLFVAKIYRDSLCGTMQTQFTIA